jgi:putative transposase|tara:strand:- start:1936 stop:2100 length:165 start_codon:yes stop_codon:yes gene_type:complete
LAALAGVAAQIGYKRRPSRYDGKSTAAVDNTVDRQFEVPYRRLPCNRLPGNGCT